jgi:hypothetical protein
MYVVWYIRIILKETRFLLPDYTAIHPRIIVFMQRLVRDIFIKYGLINKITDTWLRLINLQVMRGGGGFLKYGTTKMEVIFIQPIV